MNNNEFKIVDQDGILRKAYILTTFNLFNKVYCIYAIMNNNFASVYCAQLLNNKLVPINDQEEKELINKIVKRYLNNNDLRR